MEGLRAAMRDYAAKLAEWERGGKWGKVILEGKLENGKVVWLVIRTEDTRRVG